MCSSSMKVISAPAKFEKRTFPVIWFGFLGLALIFIALGESSLAAIFPLGMMIFGYFLFKHIAWDLVDEVVDLQDSLVFRKGEKEQIVSFADIINISYTHMHSPERVIIYSRTKGAIGNELAFKPLSSWNPFAKSPIVEELIQRVERARNT